MSFKLTDTCLKKAAEDEPIFVLRAQDKLAPNVVRHWAREAHNYGTPITKVNEAFGLANMMESWQDQNFKKVPD